MAGTDSTGEVWEFEPCASMLTISYVAATKSQSLVHPALLALHVAVRAVLLGEVSVGRSEASLA